MTKSKGLTGNALKYIAITAMLIDHIAWAFVPFGSALGQVMHIIGRITAPTMCYFIAEGYHHTHNVKKYALRLAIFAAISYFAYTFEHTGTFLAVYNAGMIYTLLLGLIALVVWNDDSIMKPLKITITVFLCLISLFGDWPIFGILYVLAFGLNYGDFKKQIKWLSIITLCMLVFASIPIIINGGRWYREVFHLGVFFAVPLLAMYNGQRGRGGKFNKWVFYVFYPLHLLILGILKYYVFK